jgi:hypothetical protein
LARTAALTPRLGSALTAGDRAAVSPSAARGGVRYGLDEQQANLTSMGNQSKGRRLIRPLLCVWCGIERPDNDDACVACGKPRFRHKTSRPEEFWERQRLIEEHRARQG